jgi:hypothetical protein
MIFGTILVSCSGIALPILAGVWLMPKSAIRPVATSRHGAQSAWLLSRRLLSRRAHRYLGWLSTAVLHRHLSGSAAPSSTVRYG